MIFFSTVRANRNQQFLLKEFGKIGRVQPHRQVGPVHERIGDPAACRGIQSRMIVFIG